MAETQPFFAALTSYEEGQAACKLIEAQVKADAFERGVLEQAKAHLKALARDPLTMAEFGATKLRSAADLSKGVIDMAELGGRILP